MYYENAIPSDSSVEEIVCQENVYKNISFENEKITFAMNGVFLGCTFKNMTCYWTQFEGTTFIDCKFSGIQFDCISFENVIFVKCIVDHCAFVNDNLGGKCTYENVTWCNSRMENCKNSPEFHCIEN